VHRSALAMDPEVLLMTSPRRPGPHRDVEDRGPDDRAEEARHGRHRHAQHATGARISDDCAFLLMGEDRAGELIEFDTTEKIFNNPIDPRTLDYTSAASADSNAPWRVPDYPEVFDGGLVAKNCGRSRRHRWRT